MAAHLGEVLFLPPPGGLGLQLTLTPGVDPHTQPSEEYIDPVLSHYYHLSPFARLHLDPPVWTAEWLVSWTRLSRHVQLLLDHSQAAGGLDRRPPDSGNLNGRSDTSTAI